MAKAYVAVDIGNSSGRVMLGRVSDDQIELAEIYRFANSAQRDQDGWHWRATRLSHEMLHGGLRNAAAGCPLDGIAVDTWGVDYGLLDVSGSMREHPFSYRDERTLPMVAIAESRMPSDLLYDLTGCQSSPINTLYQLLADQHSGRLDESGRFLLMPDLFAYWLTGG